MKKGQVWQMDFLFAIILSTITLIIFVNFTLVQTNSTDITELSLTATAMSESLMTQGLPTQWTNNTVRSIGLLDRTGRINQTKLQWFYSMSESEYRVLFTQRNLYHIQLTQKGIPLSINDITYVGFPKTDAKSAITISRYVLYQGEITTIEVTLWK